MQVYKSRRLLRVFENYKGEEELDPYYILLGNLGNLKKSYFSLNTSSLWTKHGRNLRERAT
jgi:hypothetical protein